MIESHDQVPGADIDKSHVDTGLVCLVMIARLHEIAVDPDQLAHQFKTDGKPLSKSDILLASKQLGLKARSVKTTLDRLDTTPLPAMAFGKDGSFFILARDGHKQSLIFNPVTARAESVSPDDMQQRWTGELILFTSRASLTGDMGKFV